MGRREELQAKYEQGRKRVGMPAAGTSSSRRGRRGGSRRRFVWIVIAARVKKTPAFFSVRQEWGTLLSSLTGPTSVNVLEQYAPEDWGRAQQLASEAINMEADPVSGAQRYESAIAALRNAVKVSENAMRMPAIIRIESNVAEAEIRRSVLGIWEKVGLAGELIELPANEESHLQIRARGYKGESLLIENTQPGEDLGVRHIELDVWNGPIAGEDWTSPSTGMEFVWIPQMKMWVGKYEVTNGEYRKKEPGHDSRGYAGHSLNEDRQPVVHVHYGDAASFAAWLTLRDRHVEKGRRAPHLSDQCEYRLPTRDEWTAFVQCGDDRVYPWGSSWPPPGIYGGNYSGRESAWRNKIDGYSSGFAVTAPVDELVPNSWGLYGVGGNVWEGTTRTPGGDFDAWRGGAWNEFDREKMRCLYRDDTGASLRRNSFGFRLVLTSPEIW